MKIETMQNALFSASVLASIANLDMPQSAYRQRTFDETAMLVARLQYGIQRRYIRLQQELDFFVPRCLICGRPFTAAEYQVMERGVDMHEKCRQGVGDE